MKKKDILFPVALNEYGEICYAKDAPKNKKCYCIECKVEMILRRKEEGIKNHTLPIRRNPPDVIPRQFCIMYTKHYFMNESKMQ